MARCDVRIDEDCDQDGGGTGELAAGLCIHAALADATLLAGFEVHVEAAILEALGRTSNTELASFAHLDRAVKNTGDFGANLLAARTPRE